MSQKINSEMFKETFNWTKRGNSSDKASNTIRNVGTRPVIILTTKITKNKEVILRKKYQNRRLGSYQ